ncbi:MAG TPA: metal ABC transporter substrate-binding protein [Thermoanaerobaculia bacterium]|nr:metal ABC transporter substrate-binding protein [Thermoanaerobaculia bacterium]
MTRARVRLAIGLSLAAAGCAPSSSRPAAGPQVAVATIAPLADLVRRVAGPEWTVRTVIRPGTSPHVFEPEPSDLRKLLGARAVFVAGAGYDDWMRKVLAACASRAPVHDAAASIGIGPGRAWSASAGRDLPAQGPEAHGEDDLVHAAGPHDRDGHAAHDHEAAGHEGHGHEDDPGGAAGAHDGHAHGILGEDPHWWLSPELAARSLGGIAEAFAAVDPIHAESYRARAREAAAELVELDGEISAKLAPVRGKRFVSAHRAWVYFADRYGLVEAASIEPVPGREPSPRELKALVTEGRQGGLGRLFTEPQFPPAAARVVANEAGLDLTLVDPIGGVPGRSTYPELMRFNADAFLRGLSGAAERRP